MEEPEVLGRLEHVDLSQQTTPVDGEQGKKETQVRRNSQLAEELVSTLYDDCDTLQSSFKYVYTITFNPCIVSLSLYVFSLAARSRLTGIEFALVRGNGVSIYKNRPNEFYRYQLFLFFKTLEKNTYGKYFWINYRKFGLKVDHFGTGLKTTLGMQVVRLNYPPTQILRFPNAHQI